MVSHRQQWNEELRRSIATAEAIRQCVAPSPRRDAWLSATVRAIGLMAGHIAGVTQAQGEAARMVAECRDDPSP